MTDWLSRYDDLMRGRRLGIRRLVLDVDAEDVRVILRLRDLDSQTPEVAALRFDGVKELRFRQVWDGFPLGIQIVSIADHGLEGLDYRVTDPEYDMVSFVCADFRIED